MKNLITCLILTISIYTLGFSQTIEEKERELFKEFSVKTRENTDYTFTKGKFSKTGRITNLSTFDKNGQILQNKSYNLKGEVTTIEKYAYDVNGNRTLYERQSLSGEYKKESEYDTDNNLVEEYGYDGSATFQTNLKYNSNNRVLEIIYTIADDIDEKRVYSYEGNTAQVQILKNGKYLSSKVNLVFNENDQVLSEVLVTLEGKILESKSYEYNTEKNIVKEIKYKNGEFFQEITYDYDDNQNLLTVSEKTKTEDKFVKKMYAYDDKGRIVKYQWKRNPNDEYNIKAYKYSDKGVCGEVHTYYPKTDYKILTRYSYTYF
jgi:hypothetical protein